MTDLKKLAEDASQGQWRSLDTQDDGDLPFDGIYRVSAPDNPMPDNVTEQFDNRPIVAECAKPKDARYIAAANPQKILELLSTIAALQQEVGRLESLVYVPGVLMCAKCSFSLISANLHVNTGQVSANNSPGHCPNGCGPMWRVTERDAGNGLIDRMETILAENKKLRRLADVRGVLMEEYKHRLQQHTGQDVEAKV